MYFHIRLNRGHVDKVPKFSERCYQNVLNGFLIIEEATIFRGGGGGGWAGNQGNKQFFNSGWGKFLTKAIARKIAIQQEAVLIITDQELLHIPRCH